MDWEIYDYREVNRNVLVTPEIRARLYHMKPGQVDSRHSHDLGYEVFLILDGRAEFNINGIKKELGPGQMCIAKVDEIHQVRNLLPDQPTIMYLSVTPHVQPTHTERSLTDEKAPPHFTPNASYDVAQDMNVLLASLLEKQVAAAEELLAAARANLAAQQAEQNAILAALQTGDRDAAVAARNAMWDAVYALHKQVYAFDEIWNETAPRIAAEAG